MKKFFTYLLMTGLASPLFAQSLVLHEGGVSMGSSITIDSLATSDHSIGNYYIVNTTGAAILITWSRTRVAHMSPYWDQICDNQLCFDAANAYNYYRPASLNVAAGDSTIFQPKVYPVGTPGCAIYTYKVYDDLGNVQDSVQIKYRFGGLDCFLDLPETPITYSVYPNPVSNQLNINTATNGNTVQISLYNIMGEIVLKEILTDGMNTISVANLTNGIYFYSMIKNGEMVETKKLIIRH